MTVAHHAQSADAGAEAAPSRRRAILVVLAHPDDESFPTGGTLARYAAEGACITLLCATRGEAGIEGMQPAETAQVRERELRRAGLTLGISRVRFLQYRDGELARADREEVVRKLLAALLELRPDVVITFGPDGISGHPDHLAIRNLTTDAFDRAGLAAALLYIAPSEATLQGCGLLPTTHQAGGPVVGIDVSRSLVTKVRAMQCHASQHPPYAGVPEEEARRLACHEYFTVARPTGSPGGLTDLFAALPPQAAQQGGWPVAVGAGE